MLARYFLIAFYGLFCLACPYAKWAEEACRAESSQLPANPSDRADGRPPGAALNIGGGGGGGGVGLETQKKDLYRREGKGRLCLLGGQNCFAPRRVEEISLFFNLSWCKIASAARN